MIKKRECYQLSFAIFVSDTSAFDLILSMQAQTIIKNQWRHMKRMTYTQLAVELGMSRHRLVRIMQRLELIELFEQERLERKVKNHANRTS